MIFERWKSLFKFELLFLFFDFSKAFDCVFPILDFSKAFDNVF